MKIFLTILSLSVQALLISLGHVLLVSAAPSPLHYINIPISAVVLTVAYREPVRALWLALGIGYALDMFSTLPFGIMLASMLGTTLCSIVLLEGVFINRSVPLIALTSIITLVSFATLQFFLINVINLVYRQAAQWPTSAALTALVGGMLMTGTVVYGICLIIRRYSVRANPRYLPR